MNIHFLTTYYLGHWYLTLSRLVPQSRVAVEVSNAVRQEMAFTNYSYARIIFAVVFPDPWVHTRKSLQVFGYMCRAHHCEHCAESGRRRRTGGDFITEYSTCIANSLPVRTLGCLVGVYAGQLFLGAAGADGDPLGVGLGSLGPLNGLSVAAGGTADRGPSAGQNRRQEGRAVRRVGGIGIGGP